MFNTANMQCTSWIILKLIFFFLAWINWSFTIHKHQSEMSSYTEWKNNSTLYFTYMQCSGMQELSLETESTAAKHQLCWIPLGHVWLITGPRIASTSDKVSRSCPNVASSLAAATFSSTWLKPLRKLHITGCFNLDKKDQIFSFLMVALVTKQLNCGVNYN